MGRQAELLSLLRKHGIEKHDFRVDIELGRFWFQHPNTERPIVVAETKGVCRGTPWEKPLREIGERLIALADADARAMDEGIRALVATVPAD